MKILLVGNYFYPEHIGGVEIVSYNLVREYRELDHQVRWVAADVPPRHRSADENDVPIRAWNITEERLGIPLPIPSPNIFRKLYPSIRWCDVIHLHDCLYPVSLFAFLISKLLRKPVLITQHTQLIPYKSSVKTWLQSLAMRTIGVFVHKYADHSVFISENTRDHLSFVTRHIRNQTVIQNGVDTDFFQPMQPEARLELRKSISGDETKPILLFVGRLVAIKGVQFLIPLIEKHQQWHWLLVGRPDEYNPSEWNYPNVTFRPSLGLEGMKDSYAVADISLHPSEVVGMSLTILECMACGTPVVLNKSVLYNIPYEDLDYFVRVKADTGEIEQAIISLLANRRTLASYARKVREYTLKQASWREVAKRYIAILQGIVSPN